MSRNSWDELKEIKASDALKQKTLAAARKMRAEENEAAPVTPMHAARRRPWGMARRILAAACAFSVVLGGTALYRSHSAPQGAGDAVAEAVMHSFGFAAYAADTGELREAKNSTIVFDCGSGVLDTEKGFYSGCLFRVTGDSIKTVSASIDKGAIYRTETVSEPVGDSQSERDAWIRALYDGTGKELNGADRVMVWGSGSVEGEEQMYADLCWKLENGFVDEYDSSASYGLWCPNPDQNDSADDQAAWHENVDFFEGAVLTVTVTFEDGAEQTRTMTLHTGKLGVEFRDGADGPVLNGEVLTDAASEDESYIYGVYGTID